MGFGYQGMMGMQGILDKTYYPVSKGDNNGLQTVAAALELIYTDKSWPSNVQALEVSLKDSGKSRADLWQFAGIVGLEVEIERANFGCDYDFNTGNQVLLYLLKKKILVKAIQIRSDFLKVRINVTSSCLSLQYSNLVEEIVFLMRVRKRPILHMKQLILRAILTTMEVPNMLLIVCKLTLD